MALTVVPVPGQSLNSSRDLISGNFATIDTDFTVDHVSYRIPNEGKHKQTTYAQQTYTLPALGPSTVGLTDQIIFARDSIAVPGTPGLFIRKANTGPNDLPAEFTYANTAVPGYTILPSGIWLAWGSANDGPNIFAQLPGGKFPNGCLNVQITINGGAIISGAVIGILVTGFTIVPEAAGGHTWSYLAIGY
jgi:hypothetical protein